MTKIGIIVGSTRPGRRALTVAEWVHGIAKARSDAEYELVDLVDYALPLLDEPLPPMMGKYSHPHTVKWSEKIKSFDGFVFVTPEYNHSTSAALKNALDYLFTEWNDKAAGFVSYGSANGARAVEHLRGIVGELKVADVRTAVLMSMFHDFENFKTFKPHERHEKTVNTMLAEVVAWSTALAPLRAK